MSLTLEQAVDALCADVAPLPQEAATLPEALGRVLAADVASPIDQPPFPRSPLDGYALLASDTAAASRESPRPISPASGSSAACPWR